MDITQDVTIVIPLRVDFEERVQNLDTVIRFFLNETQAKVIILEADTTPKYKMEEDSRISYYFYEDNNPFFHRTRYINTLLRKATTGIVGVWDTDVLFGAEQLEEAIEEIRNGATICFPYSGNFVFLNAEISKEVRQDYSRIGEYVWRRDMHSVGGAFFVNREEYLRVGGENENFYAWGPEDMERVKRLEILGYTIHRVKGNLYHLDHPRGNNSMCHTLERKIHNLKTLLNICRMNREELLEHIEGWEWKKA